MKSSSHRLYRFSTILFFIILCFINASHSSSESKEHSLEKLNYKWIYGFYEDEYQVHIGDVNNDGFPDFKVIFENYKFNKERRTTFDNRLTDFLKSRYVKDIFLGRNPYRGSNRITANTVRFISIGPGSFRGVLGNETPEITQILSVDWTRISAKILWADIDGDRDRDLLIIPSKQDSRNSEYGFLPSLAVKPHIPWPPFPARQPRDIYQNPGVSSVIDQRLLGYSLSDFAKVVLKDIDGDGRADITAWPGRGSNVGVKYAKGLPDGSFQWAPYLRGDDVPSKTSNCLDVIKTPLRSSGFFTNDECDTVFVLPPSEGISSVSRVTVNKNIDLCPVIEKRRKDEQKTLAKMSSLNEELTSLLTSMISSKELDRLNRNLDYAKREGALSKERKETYERNLQRSKVDLDDAREDFDDGFIDQLELDKYIKIYAAKKNQLDAATLDYIFAMSIVSREEKTLFVYISNKIEEKNQIQGMLSSLRNVYEKSRNLAKELTKLEGGVILFRLQSDWSKDVLNYGYLNQSFGYQTFKKMPLSTARLVSGLTQDSGNLTGVLWTRMKNIPNQENFRNDDRYGASAPAIYTTDNLSTIFQTQPVVPGRDEYYGEMGVNINLLCEHYPNGRVNVYDIPKTIHKLPSILSLSLRQNYQLKTGGEFRAIFNLSELVNHIFQNDRVNSNQDAAFISSFIHHNFLSKDKQEAFTGAVTLSTQLVINYINSISEDIWFSIRFLDKGLSLSQQEKIRVGLKTRIIDRVLSAISIERRIDKSEETSLSTSEYVVIDARRLRDYLIGNTGWQYTDVFIGKYETRASFTDYRSR